jgi:hypothetical protein
MTPDAFAQIVEFLVSVQIPSGLAMTEQDR